MTKDPDSKAGLATEQVITKLKLCRRTTIKH